ncbi:MAG: hypothetical protein ACKPB0_11775 [Opitutaceae bacterium]
MKASLLDWLLDRLGVVIFVVIFVVQIIRGLLQARRQTPPPASKPDALDEERRVQEIQEQIRRRIAERRGEAPPPAAAPELPPLARREAPAAPGPETTRMPEPFEDPLRRMVREFERALNPEPELAPAPAAPPVAAATVAEAPDRRAVELERQRRLADELRQLEAERAEAKRRAARESVEAAVATASARAHRGGLAEELRDAASARRAIILREVLGTPVGLR